MQEIKIENGLLELLSTVPAQPVATPETVHPPCPRVPLTDVCEKSAYAVWKEQQQSPFIITMCRELDAALGGGIRIGAVSELYGEPGSGKTQLCLQLCVNVQVPREIGGVAGTAIFVDTCSGFSPQRCRDIAASYSSHLAKQAIKIRSISENVRNSFLQMTEKKILDSVRVEFIQDFEQLYVFLFKLSDYITACNARLVVIDSITFPLPQYKIAILHNMIGILQRIAYTKKCAIVLTNQIKTTRVDDGQTKEMTMKLTPAMGKAHHHLITQVIHLQRSLSLLNTIEATVVKSSSSPGAFRTIECKIRKGGIRGKPPDVTKAKAPK